MEKKIKIRALKRALETISERFYNGYSQDMEMDGSGDCGAIIAENYEKAQNEYVNKLFKKMEITPEEFSEALTEYAKIEKQYIQSWETPLSAMHLMNLPF